MVFVGSQIPSLCIAKIKYPSILWIRGIKAKPKLQLITTFREEEEELCMEIKKAGRFG